VEARLINKPSEWPSQPEDALNVVGGAPLESADRHSAKPSRDSSGMICARQFFVLDFGRLLGVLFDTTCIHKMVRNVGLYLPRMKGYVLDWLQDVCTRDPAKHPSPEDIGAHVQPTCCSNL